MALIDVLAPYARGTKRLRRSAFEQELGKLRDRLTSCKATPGESVGCIAAHRSASRALSSVSYDTRVVPRRRSATIVAMERWSTNVSQLQIRPISTTSCRWSASVYRGVAARCRVVDECHARLAPPRKRRTSHRRHIQGAQRRGDGVPLLPRAQGQPHRLGTRVVARTKTSFP